MIVLDASILVALLEAGDAHHDRSVELLTAFAGENWAINVLTMAEVLVAPSRSGRLEEALAVLEPLQLEVRSIEAGQSAQLAAIRARTGLKMPDACVLLTALVDKASLATFDERLASAAGQNAVPVLQ